MLNVEFIYWLYSICWLKSSVRHPARIPTLRYRYRHNHAIEYNRELPAIMTTLSTSAARRLLNERNHPAFVALNASCFLNRSVVLHSSDSSPRAYHIALKSRSHKAKRINNLTCEMVSEFSARDGTAGAVGLAAGFFLGFLTNRILRRLKMQDVYYESDEEGEPPASYRASGEEHKLVLCVRADLKMQKGKIAAQVGHATLGAFKAAARRAPAALKTWEVNAQPKIAVQIRSQKEARQLQRHADSLGLVTYMVYDAGRTQIAAVSFTHLVSRMHSFHDVFSDTLDKRRVGKYDCFSSGPWSC